jgi:hypothetical protein
VGGSLDGTPVVAGGQDHGARCLSKKDPCCFREDPAMADAIKRLKARLKN